MSKKLISIPVDWELMRWSLPWSRWTFWSTAWPTHAAVGQTLREDSQHRVHRRWGIPVSESRTRVIWQPEAQNQIKMWQLQVYIIEQSTLIPPGCSRTAFLATGGTPVVESAPASTWGHPLRTPTRLQTLVAVQQNSRTELLPSQLYCQCLAYCTELSMQVAAPP